MARNRKVVEFSDRQIAVPLSEKEQSMKARELADLCDEVDRERAAAKADASGARKKIRALEERRRLLAQCVRTGSEKQNAQVDLFRAPKPPSRAEAKDREPNGAFTAPESSPFTESLHGPTKVDERDAFLANKSATTAPAAPPAPPPAELIAKETPLASSAAEFGDPWDPPVDVEPPPAKKKQGRPRKNAVNDGPPEAA